jgi:hypothetical protein
MGFHDPHQQSSHLAYKIYLQVGGIRDPVCETMGNRNERNIHDESFSIKSLSRIFLVVFDPKNTSLPPRLLDVFSKYEYCLHKRDIPNSSRLAHAIED